MAMHRQQWFAQVLTSEPYSHLTSHSLGIAGRESDSLPLDACIRYESVFLSRYGSYHPLGTQTSPAKGNLIQVGSNRIRLAYLGHYHDETHLSNRMGMAAQVGARDIARALPCRT